MYYLYAVAKISLKMKKTLFTLPFFKKNHFSNKAFQKVEPPALPQHLVYNHLPHRDIHILDLIQKTIDTSD